MAVQISRASAEIQRRTRLDLLVVVLATLSAILLSWLSVARYTGYNAGMFDLGNMAQSMFTGTRGQPLLHTSPDIGPRSRLNVHVELFYYLLIPFYALWPDPRLLLIVQAALFVLGSLPVYRLALRRTESIFAARCLALIYLLYPVAQTSVLFDFHGDTLAMPLLVFALDALDRRAWRSYVVWLVLGLLCKFYVAAVVAGIGLYLLLWSRERKAGIATLAGSIVYGMVAFLVIRPLFAPPSISAAQSTQGYILHYFGAFSDLAETLPQRLGNALIVFGPALFVAWRGWRWLLPALPIAAAALLSTGPGGAYDYRYHHYALVVPFVVMAAIDGAARLQATPTPQAGRRTRSWRADIGFATAIVVLFSVLLVDTPLNPLFWLGGPGRGFDSSVYGVVPRDSLKTQFLEKVPVGAPIVASNQLAPHLTNRDTLYLLRYADEAHPERLLAVLPQVDYAVADALFDLYIPTTAGFGGGVTYDQEAIAQLLRDPAFGLVAEHDGLLLFRRNPAPAEALEQQVELLDAAEQGAVSVAFGDAIELIDAQIAPAGGRRYRATFRWRASGTPGPVPFVAVSSLDGVNGARMVHLPSFALLPTSDWQQGQIVRETFEVELPPEIAPGTYAWRVGWYDSRSPGAAASDPSALMSGSQTQVVATILVP